jgi:hypothetical protein
MHQYLKPEHCAVRHATDAAGHRQQGPPEFRRSAELQIDYRGSEVNVLYDTINWADLLRDSAWNGGLVP